MIGSVRPHLDPLAAPLGGVQLVEASAGTGKTFTLTLLFLRLVLERELSVSQILVVTFTHAATDELRDRVRRRLREALSFLEGRASPDALARGDVMYDWLDARAASREADRARLVEAVRAMDEASIFTIHGFCQRALGEHAFESGLRFGLELLPDQSNLLDEVACDFWACFAYRAPEPRLRALGTAGVRLETLKSLAGRVVADPDMPVVPPAPGRIEETAAAFDAAAEALRTAKQRLAVHFRASARRVAALLAGDNLKANVYGRERARDACQKLDDWLDDDGALDPFERFTLFLPDKLAAATKKGKAPPAHSFFDACEGYAALHQSHAAAAAAHALSVEHSLIDYARAELASRKERAGQLAFDDLLLGLARALERGAGAAHAGGDALARQLRKRYPAALIDEFQDTNPVQYRIFHHLYGGPETSGGERDLALFLVGDPKQAIYAFRGADIQAYLGAQREAHDGGTLGVNFRSDPDLVRGVNTLFSRAPAPFFLDEIRFQEVRARPGPDSRLALPGRSPDAKHGSLRFRFIPRTPDRLAARKHLITKKWADEHLPAAIASEIARLLAARATVEDQPLHAGHVAVLVATHKHGRLVQEELRRVGIPSVLHGDANVFDSAEAAELLRVLAAVADPGDGAAVRTALATSIFGYSAEQILALRDDERRWQEEVDRFALCGERWRSRGFMAAFRLLLQSAGAAARLLGFPDGERRLTNLLHLGELLSSEAASRARGAAGLLTFLARVVADSSTYEGPAQDAAQIRLESDDDAVQVITMHRSKGLEFPVVLCPYLWDGALLKGDDDRYLRFHDSAAGGRRSLAITGRGGDDDRWLAEAEKEAFAERLRLAYVALTRARNLCIVFWGGFNQAETSPLAWLLHQGHAAAATPEEAFAALRERFSDLDDDALRADLAALAEAARGAISIEDLDTSPAPPLTAFEANPPALAARAFDRDLDDRFRTTSFSALAASGLRAGSAASAEGVDRDATPSSEDPIAPAPPTIRLHEFERGARAGSVLHEILEHHDFQSADHAALHKSCADRLALHGLPAGQWAAPVADTLRDVLEAPLPPLFGAKPFSLSEVASERRIAELSFFLPVAGGLEPDSAGAVSAPHLCLAFSRHAAPHIASSYPARLAAQRFVPVEGFLRGFIDLVFEHEGRYYLVDWKSNHLGPRHEDYAPARLLEPMLEGHYVLQYHLYAVAVHRLLARRVPDYDYDRHFGGAYYLFLRGMSPPRPNSEIHYGVWADRPPRALIEALSAVLDGKGFQGAANDPSASPLPLGEADARSAAGEGVAPSHRSPERQ